MMLSKNITHSATPIGDKLSLNPLFQEGQGDKLRGGLTRLGRGDLTIPKSLFLGAVK